MRHLLMIIAFKCCCFHAAFTFTLLGNRLYRLRNTIWELHDAEKELLNPMFLRWTFLFSIIYCSDSDIFHSHWSLHPLLHLRTSRKIPCAALSSSLHFHALFSLSFPLSPYHLASHLWQDTGEQLPGPDLYLSNALPRLAPSSPPLLPCPHDSRPPLPLSLLLSTLWSVLCGSSSISEQKHTLIPISPLSVEYTTWDAQQMIFTLPLSLSVSFFLSLHVPVM